MKSLGFQGFGTSASSNPNRLLKTTNSYCGAFVAYVGSPGGLEKCNNTHFLLFHKKWIKEKNAKNKKKKLRKKNLSKLVSVSKLNQGFVVILR